jgi:predicted nucleotidyltransferase
MASQQDGYDYADEGELLQTLDEAQGTLRTAAIPFLVMGGIASAILGRPRWTRDIDLFVRLEDAGRAIEQFDAAGFDTSVEHPHWLAKAWRGDVVVDVISRSHKDILLDDEMLERAVEATFKEHAVRLVPPEDLVVMKAVAASEDTPRYWYDAIGIIGRAELDWDYLARRARPAGARRVLAVLLYAQSIDVIVPTHAIRALLDLVLEPQGAPASRPEVEAVAS